LAGGKGRENKCGFTPWSNSHVLNGSLNVLFSFSLENILNSLVISQLKIGPLSGKESDAA
jgi:hypothetical protein